MKRKLSKVLLLLLAGIGTLSLIGAALFWVSITTKSSLAPFIYPQLEGGAGSGEQSRGLELRLTQPAPAPAPQAGAAAVPKAPPQAPASRAPQQAGGQAQADVTERLIVRSGNLTLQVNDVADAAAEARRLADALGGYVVNSTQREDSGRPIATVTVRVPANRFDDAMERFKGLAAKVSNEQVSSRDITEEFVDTDARLRNLRATEARYLELLQQARTVDEILRVEQQLTNVRGQIEQLQGRLNFLQRSAELSAITLELRPYAAAQPPVPTDWSLLPVVRSAWAALLNTVQLVVSLLVWGAIFTPIWLPLAYLVWRWRRRRSRMVPATG